MKQLLRKPFLLALILSLPLWLAFNNYIVALCVALLVAFLVSMIDSIIAIQAQRKNRPSSPGRTSPSDSDPHP